MRGCVIFKAKWEEFDLQPIAKLAIYSRDSRVKWRRFEMKYTGPVLYSFILYSFDSPTQFNKIPDTPHSCLGGDHWCLLWCLDASVIDKINTLGPRQNGRYCTDDTFKYIFLNKILEFRLTFHWSVFLGFQLTIFRHWFRWWQLVIHGVIYKTI